MKIVILISTISMWSSITIIHPDKHLKNHNDFGQICCVRTETVPSTGESVSVRACVTTTGDAVIDKGKACEKASKAAKKAVKDLAVAP